MILHGGVGSVIENKFEKKFYEFYFCSEPDKFFNDHFPEVPKWQLISPSLFADEFEKRIKFYSSYYSLFTDVDIKYHTIKVKNKTKIRFYKKTDKVEF